MGWQTGAINRLYTDKPAKAANQTVSRHKFQLAAAVGKVGLVGQGEVIVVLMTFKWVAGKIQL